jgi:sterol desaturase/sphingolipid hydroxylase (fatty acid hydroxylase superfamily)
MLNIICTFAKFFIYVFFFYKVGRSLLSYYFRTSPFLCYNKYRNKKWYYQIIVPLFLIYFDKVFSSALIRLAVSPFQVLALHRK